MENSHFISSDPQDCKNFGTNCLKVEFLLKTDIVCLFASLLNLHARHRGLAGYSAIQQDHAQGLFSIVGEVSSELEVPPNETPRLMTLQHHDTIVLQSITSAKSPYPPYILHQNKSVLNLFYYNFCSCACCFVLLNRYWRIVVVPRFSRASQRGRTHDYKSPISLLTIAPCPP